MRTVWLSLCTVVILYTAYGRWRDMIEARNQIGDEN
jgi:hypothetical protein